MQQKKGAHAVSVGGGATSTNQSVSLLFAQMRPDRKTKRPLSREKPMIWARKVALPKLHAWNGLVGRSPEKKRETGRGHDDALFAERGPGYYYTYLVPTCYTSTVDTYPRSRELDGLKQAL